MPVVTEEMITSFERAIEQIQDYRETLATIATMWPDPESCGDMSVNGVNDGRARLITAHSAINAARKALGLSLHEFPGK